MPQRPCWYQRERRYCCAIERSALVICSELLAATFSRSSRARLTAYGSTAPLDSVMPGAPANETKLDGFSQPASSAICFDRPITTAVEQPVAWYSPTVESW